jgi:hypothetical protein
VRALLAVVALALLWLLLSIPVGADGDGVIEGRVVNGSDGGGPMGDLVVTLSTDDPETAGESAARTNPLGQFRFERLSTSPDVYTLSVSYQGVDYAVRNIQIDARSPSGQAELRVYEATTSAVAVTVLLDHQIVTVRPDEHRLEVVNYIDVANAGDRTVVGYRTGDADASVLSLPEGAENVQFLGALSKTGSLVDGRHSNLNQVIPPGEHELLIAYEMPYADQSFIFRKPLDFHTEKAVFLISARDAKAESLQLSAMKEADTAAGAYQILSADDLPAATVLEVTLTGLPASGGTSVSGLLAATAVILAILVLGTMVAYARLRRRRVPARASEA